MLRTIRRRRTILLPLVGAAISAAPTSGSAQAPAAPPAPPPAARQDAATDHDGFWIGFGFGAGNLSVDCGTCGPGPLPREWSGGRSTAAHLAMGGTLRPNVLLGGEIVVNFNGNLQRSANVGHVGVVTQLYPRGARGLFVRAGAGIGVAILTDEALGFGEGAELTSDGVSVRAGVGYDFRFGGRFALTPYVDYSQLFSSGTAMTVNGRSYRGPENPGALQVGLSFNWY